MDLYVYETATIIHGIHPISAFQDDIEMIYLIQIKGLVLRKDEQNDRTNLFSLLMREIWQLNRLNIHVVLRKSESLCKHTMHFSACWLCARRRPFYFDLKNEAERTNSPSIRGTRYDQNK